jgi:hypothetical protein
MGQRRAGGVARRSPQSPVIRSPTRALVPLQPQEHRGRCPRPPDPPWRDSFTRSRWRAIGDGRQLAHARGEAEYAATLHHRDRWARHPFHPCALAARGRAAACRQPRLARLDHRAAEDHRSTDRSHGTWRQRIGRFSCGDPIDAGLRVSGKPASTGWPRAHRPGLGRTDGATRLHPVRHARRRLGCICRRPDGLAGTGRIARHPHQHAVHCPRRHRPGRPGRRPATLRPLSGGTTCLRAADQNLPASRVRQIHGGAPADLVRHPGFTQGRDYRLSR